MGDRFEQLSPRHRQCLRLVYRRRTTKEIAAELGIMPGTVGTYCTEAIAILGARNRRAAAEMLHEHERTTPSGLGPPSLGLSEPPDIDPSGSPTGRADLWWGALSVRNRDADNELSTAARIAWIIGLAIALAIGFGTLASGVRTVGDIVTAGGRR